MGSLLFREIAALETLEGTLRGSEGLEVTFQAIVDSIAQVARAGRPEVLPRISL